MRKDLTQLVIISDRSGSMGSCMLEAQNAINRMIDDQKKVDGECLLTFVEFDDEYNVVHDGVNIKSVGEYTLIPRGLTALYDAIGKAVTTTGEKLANMPENEQPALVVVVISTDGMNNASKEYTKEQIAKMIEEQQTKYSWQFVFLGVGLDQFTVEQITSGINIPMASSVSVSRDKGDMAYDVTSRKLRSARCSVAQGHSISGAFTYSDDERSRLV